MDVIPAFWDDELERLAVKVQEVFGDMVLDTCVYRASSIAFQFAGCEGPTPRADRSDPLVTPADVFRKALKTELRRRLRPN
jgi:hypothetical protein